MEQIFSNLNDVLVDHEPILIKSDSDTTESSNSDSANSGIGYRPSTSKPIKKRKGKNKRRKSIVVKQAKNPTPWMDKCTEISLTIKESSLDSSTEVTNEIDNEPDMIATLNNSDKPRFSDIFKKIVDTTTVKDLERKRLDKLVEIRKKI
jgi:hypothetical protein